MNFEIARRRMVDSQLTGRGISDPRVVEAMLRVPRHLFVEEAMAAQAYSDTSLPIGEKQTISQPYIVALMTELLQLGGSEKVLEIGTGSGYQTAVLASLADRIYTIERVRPLALKARRALDGQGFLNINLRIGDGTDGWDDEKPFDAIIVTAGAPAVPQTLLGQLNYGGRLVIPTGSSSQQVLHRYTKGIDGTIHEEQFTACRFVKLIGKFGWNDDN
jgi:protein-L-isoaspartate(D-aspartate) O-methyltransferase